MSFQIAYKIDPETKGEKFYSTSKIAPNGTIVFVYSSFRDEEVATLPTTKKLFDQILSTFKFLPGSSPENLVIDSSKTRVGDSIGAFAVTSMKPLNNQAPLSNKNISITFSGQAQLSGNYFLTQPGLTEGGEPCFGDLDPQSKLQLPVLKDDGRDIWFCFDNSKVAIEHLGSTDHKATILIDNYTINNLPAEVWNTAKFIEK